MTDDEPRLIDLTDSTGPDPSASALLTVGAVSVYAFASKDTAEILLQDGSGAGDGTILTPDEADELGAVLQRAAATVRRRVAAYSRGDA